MMRVFHFLISVRRTCPPSLVSAGAPFSEVGSALSPLFLTVMVIDVFFS